MRRNQKEKVTGGKYAPPASLVLVSFPQGDERARNARLARMVMKIAWGLVNATA
jgi:hypothetical protein